MAAGIADWLWDIADIVKVVEAAEPIQGETLTVGTSDGGWAAQIFAAGAGPPEALEEWGEPVGAVSNAEAEELIELTVAAPAQYYLIWFTKLVSYDDGYRVEVEELTLSGEA